MYLASAIVFCLLLGVGFLAVLLKARLRRRVEVHLNARLRPYVASLGSVKLHPFGFFISLKNLAIGWKDPQIPPLAHIQEWQLHIPLRSLLSRKLTARMVVTRPSLQIDPGKVAAGVGNEPPTNEGTWPRVMKALFPFETIEFTLEDGEIQYVGGGDSRPLRMRQVSLLASNIRPAESQGNSPPCQVRGEGLVLDSGRIVLEGHADLFAEPHPVFELDYRVEQLDLGYFQSLIGRANISVRRGLISALEGKLTYTQENKTAEVRSLEINGLEVDYVLSSGQEERGGKLKQEDTVHVEQDRKWPNVFFIIDAVRVSDGNLGFVNKRSDPEYRIFMARSNIMVRDYSSKFQRGRTHVEWRGDFMGSGYTHLLGNFRQETDGPDFDLKVAVEGTRMTALNRVLRALAGFELTEGRFSLYSEITVRDGKIGGDVDPVFENMEIYRDGKESLLQKFLEATAAKVMGFFEREPAEKETIQTRISAILGHRDVNTWRAVATTAKVAFSEVILPTFEREIRSLRHGGSE